MGTQWIGSHVRENCEDLETLFKNIRQKENKSGSGNVSSEFYDVVADILENDPFCVPPTKVSYGLEMQLVLMKKKKLSTNSKRKRN